jgi:hypothetical protein
MTVSWPIESRCYDLAKTALLHLCNLFGALIYEEDHEVALWAVLDDTFSDGLENHSLTGLGRRNYHGPLSLTKRAKQIDYPIRKFRFAPEFSTTLQNQLIIWVHRAELLKFRSPLSLIGWIVIHESQVSERWALPGPSLTCNNTHQLVSSA